ncbi:MAG: CAP domain-containing protein [Gemmatimonadaceae bacterium]
MDPTRFAIACAVSLLAVGCAVPVASPVPAGPTPRTATGKLGATESRIFELINAERRHNGLAALVYNPQLDRMAKIQAQNMAHFQKMAHVLPESELPTLTSRAQYVGYPFGRIAENVALGYPSAETVVQGWMASKGHRANILNADVGETGIGIARSSAGGIYYCQVFGRQLRSL